MERQDVPESRPSGLPRRQVLIRGGLAAGGAVALALGMPGAASPVRAATEDFDAEVPTAWFDLLTRLVRTTAGFSPPVVSRVCGYAGVALYETVVSGSAEYRSLRPAFDSLPPVATGDRLDWAVAANAGLARMFRLLFTTTSDANQAAIESLESSLARRSGLGPTSTLFNASARHGQTVAERVIDWARGDGGHEGHLRNHPPGYILPTGPGLWVPTPTGYLPALQPTWGSNRCFALATASACPAGSRTHYSEQPLSPFYAEAWEVYETVNNLTTEQSAIAWFWSDDPATTATPPGHLIAITTQVLRAERASLMAAAEAYAKVGIALADAFIACWHAKYQHNLLRPVSYLNAHVDANWLPLLSTPPFPEYPSGHSVQSGAAFHVLADLFGEDYPFDDHAHDERGMSPRHFRSFAHAAEEAAISRLYGGIHYRPAIEDGLRQGRCVGEVVNALPFKG
jgi:hypothetical protein